MIYENGGTAELVIDGDLITAKHPGIVDRFLQKFVAEMEKETQLNLLNVAG